MKQKQTGAAELIVESVVDGVFMGVVGVVILFCVLVAIGQIWPELLP